MAIFKRLKAKRQEELNHSRQIKREQLFQKVREIVSKELDVKDPETIKPATRFKEDLGMDSLSSLELIMDLEDTFGLEISDSEAEKLLTVEDVINYLEKKV